MALPPIPHLSRDGLLEAVQNGCRFCKLLPRNMHEHPDNTVFRAINSIEDCFVYLRGFPNSPVAAEFGVYDPEHGKVAGHK